MNRPACDDKFLAILELFFRQLACTCRKALYNAIYVQLREEFYYLLKTIIC